MQKGLNEFSSVGKLHTLDAAVGVLDELIIAGAFSFLPGDSFGIAVFIDRPHGVGVEGGSDVVVLARFNEMAGFLDLFGQLFAPRGHPCELARHVDKFLNPPGDFLKIALHARAAVAENLSSAALIPVDPACLDDLIQNPSLFAPAFHFSFCFHSHSHSSVSFLTWDLIESRRPGKPARPLCRCEYTRGWNRDRVSERFPVHGFQSVPIPADNAL